MDRPALVRIHYDPRSASPTSMGGKSSRLVLAGLGSSVVVFGGGIKGGGKHDCLYCNEYRQTATQSTR